jgi:hypothetical protein
MAIIIISIIVLQVHCTPPELPGIIIKDQPNR